jgi:PPOX class probable F420-dependent enzyme
MTAALFPDPSTDFGRRVRQRLRDEQVIWLTTVGGDGTPQPNPVWFLWEGTGIWVYNRSDAKRLVHIRSRPKVSLHFDGNGRGGDIVVLNGHVQVLEDHRPAHELTGFRDKYHEAMNRVSGSPAAFSEAYPVPVRIDITRIRGS